jgi:hypothetical protein
MGSWERVAPAMEVLMAKLPRIVHSPLNSTKTDRARR